MEWTTNMEGGGTLYFRDDGSYLYFEARRPYEKKEPEGAYQVILQGMQGGQLLGKLIPWEGGWKLSRMVPRSTLEKWGCLPVTKVICQKSYGWGREDVSEVDGEERRLQGEYSVKGKYLHELEGKEAEKEALPEQREEKEIWRKMEETNLTGSQLLIGEETQTIKAEEGASLLKIPPGEEQWVALDEYEEGLEGFTLCSKPWTMVEDAGIASLLRLAPQVYRREEDSGITLAIPYGSDKEFPLLPLFCISSIKREREQNFVLFSFTKEGKPTINSLA